MYTLHMLHVFEIINFLHEHAQGFEGTLKSTPKDQASFEVCHLLFVHLD
jgi:hypothetical protein